MYSDFTLESSEIVANLCSYVANETYELHNSTAANLLFQELAGKRVSSFIPVG